MTRAQRPELILGLETSCDETSAAVLSGHHDLLGHVILSQDIHAVYGGVVPELAAREHLRRVDDVVAQALAESGRSIHELDAVAATTGPGLAGPLLVGASWARAFALAIDRPFVPVHHMEAHLFGPAVEDEEAHPPFVALLVSGGHTLLLHAEEWGRYTQLGSTRDDAAGEAFDKVAKALGLPYPGGPALEKLAVDGDPARYRLPRPLLNRGDLPGPGDYFDFSFSGLKTAVARVIEELDEQGTLATARADVAASFQEAVVDVLDAKVARAIEWTGCDRVLIGGGVSANQALRSRLGTRVGESGKLFVASIRLSLDNGAMVARAGLEALRRGDVATLDPNVSPTSPFPGAERLDEPGGASRTKGERMRAGEVPNS
jgi:N6-L-threonylcarbamoyladenine synthase